ncbi:MAG: SpoIID/LytB domain-containing protein [Prolixibacteraceae bacterium]|nr:SpoIID/LytB domain-containing protein [Prolixibacteraceae bacterium]
MEIINQEPIIKVGIIVDRVVNFTLKGDYIFNGNIIPAGDYCAIFQENKIKTSFGESAASINLTPVNDETTFTINKVLIGIGFHWENTETQEFEGGIILIPEEDKVRILNTITLEKYLKSVISSEMSAMNDINLLTAHAIISSSWLLSQISGKKTKKKIESGFAESDQFNGVTAIIKWYDREDHENFDVCADDHCQRYQGISRVISANAIQAINNTRGIVLTYNNDICDARFSKCCGGITEDFENVWQAVKIPYLVSGKDFIPENEKENTDHAFCDTTDNEVLSQILVDFDLKTTNFYQWNTEYSQEEISSIIKKKSGIDFGDIIDFEPLKRGKSGRIIKLKIIGSKKTVIVGKELEIRKWLSENHLYSSALEIKKEFKSGSEVPVKFYFEGKGWGHGVGMCQIGAAMMSKKGYNYEQILRHYYKGTKLSKIY